jgi:hypothetical protein
VGSDHGAVEDQPLQVGVLQDLEDSEPDTLGGPTIEPPPDRIGLSEPLGQVAPGGPGLGDPEDGVDEESVVFGGDTGVSRLAGEEVLDPFPVFICYGVTTHTCMLGGLKNGRSLVYLTKIPQIMSTRPNIRE